MNQNNPKGGIIMEKKQNNTADNTGKRKDPGKLKIYKRFKWYHWVAAAIVLIVVLIFLIWHIKPSRALEVAVLDKTVLSYSEDDDIVKDTVYRKHQGLFWLMNQQKYVKSDGTSYDFTKDYYGPILDEEGAPAGERELKSIKTKPDLLYLADAYGLGNDSFGYYNGGSPKNGGISNDDLSVVAYAYGSGAPIIGETTLFSSPLSDSVYSQLTSLFGVTPKKWIGRYIVDLEDFTDIPDWAPPMYEQQEGVEWRFTGPGILLVSSDGKIIVLEQNTDFSSKDLLKIYINEKYKGEFPDCSDCNFYNWFELIDANYGTESIATFDFDLNATGMEKIKEISKTPRFCAIARKKEKNRPPVYYFSGDFNDYVNGERYGQFLFANQLFKFLSFDRQGDISNFYWNFYNPLMRNILDKTSSTVYVEKKDNHKEVSRLRDNKFQVLEDKKWKSINLKAVSINAFAPGENQYSREFTFYEELVKSASELNANCIVAKDLLPPEFYTAVDRFNASAKNKRMYIMQRIPAPEGLNSAEYMSESGLASWKKKIETVIKALHGDGTAKSTVLGEASYFTNVSSYLIGITVDPSLDDNACAALGSINYTYSGKYTNTQNGLTGFAAYLYDNVEKFSKKKYHYFIPASVCSKLNMVSGMTYARGANSYLFSDIASKDCSEYFYSDVEYERGAIQNAKLNSPSEYEKTFAALSELNTALNNIVLSGISFSDANSVYKRTAVTEAEQGRRLVDTLAAVRDNKCPGAAVYDLNDCWNQVSDDMKVFTSTDSSTCNWHNTCDEKQMTGIVAMEAKQPEKPGLVLSDDDVVQAVSMSSNAGYMYITLQLLHEMNYKDRTLFIGIDTFQRNDGEYYYDKDFTPNSLSGMEYVLRFDDKQKGSLNVIRSYDRSEKNSAFTMESYKAKFDKVSDLTYGGFNTYDSQFYQTGSTIYIRLPWTWLNFFDPTRKLVINDHNFGAKAKTTTTNGMLVSIMIGENSSGDLYYGFPKKKHDPGYKMFKPSIPEKVDFDFRTKDSYTIVSNYYSEN
jgi:hypothetical protein